MKTLLKSIFCLLIVVAFVPAHRARAQGSTRITVTGKVLDSKDKQSVIGASVVELDADKRTIRGASTDIEGNFAIQVSNPKGTLQVSYLGYKTQVIQINGRTSINVLLVSSANEISEVAITARRTVSNGTGLNIDERNSTAASATISAEDLKELSAQSIDQALQGRLPGVDVGTSSGDPGAGMSIRIRGTSSINGSAEPLIVLDGMPYETQIPPDFNFGTADEQGYAQLLNIAPSDIKDITVLKDAASTAVWGSRASNGVLIITTKRGTIGKPILTYNMKATLSKQPENIPLLTGNQYSMLIPEEINNMNLLPLDITRNPELAYDPLMPANYYNYSNNSNWIDAITQLGYSHDHSLSMQGGGEKARYYASVGYLGQQGTTIGTDLSRITTKINLDYNVSSRIRFRSDFTYTHVNNTLNYSGSIRNIAYTKMPNMAIYSYDEYGNLTPNYFSPAVNIQGQYRGLNDKGELQGTVNPLAMAQEAMSHLYGERVTPKFNLQFDIVPSRLLTTLDLQFDINNTKSKTFLPQIATGRPATETFVNRATDADGDNFIVSSKLNFIYTPQLPENHTLQTLLSFQTDDSKVVNYYALTANTASSNLQDPADPSRTQNGDLNLKSTNSQTRAVGVVLTNQYSFMDRYILNVGARVDGNSRFGSNYRYGIFPSVSARWRASGEPFMKNATWIDDLSFRVSYGQSGKQPNKDYTFYNTYNPTSFTYLGMSGVVPGAIGLDNLKWETNIGRNIGFNLWTLKSRVKLDVEVYKNKIVDLFFDKLQVPDYTGYTTLSVNVGTMTNQGFEVGLNTIPYRSKKWTVGFDFNVAQNLNIIRKVSEFYPRTDGKRINQNGIYRTFLQIGNPFGSFYGFRYKGVYSDKNATIATDAKGNQIVGPNDQVVYMRFNYPATDYTFQAGDAMYEDINKDGNINEDDIVYLGNSNPKVTGGFGPSVTFKGNLRLQAFFNYKFGVSMINETLMKTTNMYSYDNQSTLVLGRWRNPGDVTDVPRALYGSGYNWLGSDRYVSDASFVKLKSVTARYNLTKPLLSKLRVKSASVYVTGENLYTWTKYRGVDPDVSTRGLNNPFSYVTDKALTPPSRNVLMGLTVGF
ncbi:SusC/RagA family TonB-linked outer membrane protein [Hufsiella ginkgonis]|uniref:SusC/RagA family TonB-linked outer membrane protein n=1 Tax=Hufsiella ginkgonis TaxID=2695274 RepID=A0A7K1Y2A8_9SPHI|nr:SusC/RagA family TonB-linked outer membrane protein [Hufsiella ginkgonis]MXV17342.1 SusC/RagA family TonB-linked outer membrane protein [Hufsiella ginkgonis]